MGVHTGVRLTRKCRCGERVRGKRRVNEPSRGMVVPASRADETEPLVLPIELQVRREWHGGFLLWRAMTENA